jgi:hypothetical protein
VAGITAQFGMGHEPMLEFPARIPALPRVKRNPVRYADLRRDRRVKSAGGRG